MGTLVMVGQLLLCLSIIVGLHELGHLVAAKVFGMRVEKYSIGFPPKIFGFTWRETEYSLGAIPLGGFVKISGMIDESFDTKHLQNEPEPWEFRAKPAWQRLIVMVGGITINVITGIMMFVGLVFIYGESYLPANEVNKYGIVAYPMAQEIGLKTGDKLLKINGKPYNKFEDHRLALIESNSYFTIAREGKTIDVKIPNDLIERLSGKKELFIEPIYPFSIGKVQKGMPAAAAGLQVGDKIVAFNDKPIQFFHEFQAEQDKFKNKEVTLKIEREGKNLNIKAKTDENGKFGFLPKIELKPSYEKFGFAESIVRGTDRAFESLYLNLMGFGKLFRGEVSAKSVSGPIGIAQFFPTTWDWEFFWRFTGILSMWLAFLNFLPIPALDGGHVMFLMYEIISGRKPSDKFLERSQMVGVVILLTLMVLVLGNDILNLFFR
ncbi:MAG: RIP metalloprotease RseP [Microscillaceae bacterium]|jgi:regulator of sigma E protease|nr:RIP metalloprotease RseP [Microscillaceae bacterium]